MNPVISLPSFMECVLEWGGIGTQKQTTSQMQNYRFNNINDKLQQKALHQRMKKITEEEPKERLGRCQ